MLWLFPRVLHIQFYCLKYPIWLQTPCLPNCLKLLWLPRLPKNYNSGLIQICPFFSCVLLIFSQYFRAQGDTRPTTKLPNYNVPTPNFLIVLLPSWTNSCTNVALHV